MGTMDLKFKHASLHLFLPLFNYFFLLYYFYAISQPENAHKNLHNV